MSAGPCIWIPGEGLLYAFVTDMNSVSSRDRILKDTSSYNSDTGQIEPKANDIPDEVDTNKNQRLRLQQNSHEFQFMVVNLTDNKNKDDNGNFAFRAFREVQNTEFRWLYWTAAEDDNEMKYVRDSIIAAEKLQEPTTSELSGSEKKYHYYRTNFYDAYPAPEDASERSFYLSHRGEQTAENSPYANAVIRVRLADGVEKADILDMSKQTKDIFNFHKIYGLASHRRLIDESREGEGQRKADNLRKDYLASVSWGSVGSSKDVLFVNSSRGRELFTRAGVLDPGRAQGSG